MFVLEPLFVGATLLYVRFSDLNTTSSARVGSCEIPLVLLLPGDFSRLSSYCMGTNYYHRYDSCDCCKRYEERHIGKNKSMFQGYFDENDYPIISSWEQWKERLRAGGTVVDEYGESHDVETFIASVEAVAPEDRRRHYDAMVSQYSRWAQFGVIPSGDWLDPDGYSFSGSEFF